MIDVLSRFIVELRESGVPVSTRESIDAAVAVEKIPLLDRAALRSALGATLVKSPAHRKAFEAAFEVFFSLRGAPPLVEEVLTGGDGEALPVATGGETPGVGGRPGAMPTPDELTAMLREALVSGSAEALGLASRLAVALYGGVEASRPVGISYYLHRTLRGVDLEGLLESLLRAGAGAGELLGLAGQGALRERFAADELSRRAAQFRELVEAEIRRLLVDGRGAGAVARGVRRPLVEDVDFMHASREELVAMRRSIYPLARILAARLARRRRRGRRGPLDFRATIRRSLSQGGVPLDPRFRPPRPARPELFVLADVSGSVASFARFTVLLVYAIAAEFSKVRTAVFIDGVDEVTGLLRRSTSMADAIERLAREADVVHGDGHSNYGSAFALFRERYGRQLTPKTDLLILGDARNNYHSSGAEELAELRRRAHRVLWLNPEPRAYWGSGDSIIAEYARHCDGVYECRNLRQLQDFIDELA
ncbi:MAG TPA: VWA domain-containing protein [Acidimicrobiales bacterium]|nr:VWA domain-containing protein [Acidimicrobiales bacterium]